MQVQYIGDSCLSLVFGEEISLATSDKVLAAYRRLRKSRLRQRLGLLDLVPTYRTLAVHLAPGEDPVVVASQLLEFFARQDSAASATAGKTVTLQVTYDGPDLERLARQRGLTAEEVVEIHSGGTYRVAMVGFRPHFPYLIGLDPRLATPRLETPRTRVPAGAVGIGGEQTGIYPEESPGGWHLIGQTDPQRLREILPGDTILFIRDEA